MGNKLFQKAREFVEEALHSEHDGDQHKTEEIVEKALHSEHGGDQQRQRKSLKMLFHQPLPIRVRPKKNNCENSRKSWKTTLNNCESLQDFWRLSLCFHQLLFRALPPFSPISL